MATIKRRVIDLDSTVKDELCMRLNIVMISKDVQALAGKMGYKWLRCMNFRQMASNPTEALLSDWCSQKGDRTVTELIKHLSSLQRNDCVEILQPHEYASDNTSKNSCKVSCEETGPKDQELEKELRCGKACEHELDPSGDDESTSVVLDSEVHVYPERHIAKGVSREGNLECRGIGITRKGEKSGNPRAAEPIATPVAHAVAWCGNNKDRACGRHLGGLIQPQPIKPRWIDILPKYHLPPMAPGGQLNRVAVARDKVALVIGNLFYEDPHYPELKCPGNDAQAIAEVLTALGFKVLSLINLTLEEMRTAMLAFSKLLGEGTFAVFYYSGHGSEVRGENFLFPVNMPASFSASRAISAQEFLQEMQNKRTLLNLIIVDACRARIEAKDEKSYFRRNNAGNTIFAYACTSHSMCFESNTQVCGEYCQLLLKHLGKDERIENILMTISTEYSKNKNWAQRPTFESDTYIECRLTAPIAKSLYPDDKYLKTMLWLHGQNVPEPVHFEYANFTATVHFRLKINNVLQILTIFANKRGESSIRETKFYIDTFRPLTIRKGINQPVQINRDCIQTSEFEIHGLQKLTEHFIVTFDYNVEWADGFQVSEYEKIDLGLPGVSAIFGKFSEWVIADNPHWTAV